MTTYNLTPSQTVVPTSAMSLLNGRVPCVVESIIDFGAPTVPNSSVTGMSSSNSASVVDCINVPAGFAVLSSGLEVLRADTAGNSGTITIKVGASGQGSAETVAATGFVASAGTYTPVVPSTAAALATLTVATGNINAVVRLFVTLLDQRARPGSPAFIGTSVNPAGQTTAYGWDPISNYTAVPLVYVV